VETGEIVAPPVKSRGGGVHAGMMDYLYGIGSVQLFLEVSQMRARIDIGIPALVEKDGP